MGKNASVESGRYFLHIRYLNKKWTKTPTGLSTLALVDVLPLQTLAVSGEGKLDHIKIKHAFRKSAGD